MRYFLEISYFGGAFHGWQVQPNALSVQEVINDALSKKLRGKIECTGSGRTDTGVHALMQIAHFDSKEIDDTRDFLFQMNSLLPKEISANDIYPVADGASARFDAISRSYIYKIHQRKDPFLTEYSHRFSRKLDLDLMNAACELFKNWQDFQAFSKVHTDVKTFDCEISEAIWKQENDQLIFCVTANRFLRGMVRAIVGTMMDVGENKISLDGFQSILESMDRKQAGRSAPAHGLYLSDIKYPKHIRIGTS
ncbi:MAG: tRNA pseudouridine(38-40) synthase TruA [Cyclobacteriaceae bacterium]